MALLPKVQVTLAGATDSLTAVSASDTFNPDGVCWLEVNNGSGSSVTVTVDSKRASDLGTDVDVVVAVPGGARRKIGPLPPQRFADPTTGLGTVTFSATTSVTAGLFFI